MENLLLHSFRIFAFARNRFALRASFYSLVTLLALLPLSTALTIAGPFGAVETASAQPVTWTAYTAPPGMKPFGFGSQIQCVKFLDKVGAPNVGFVCVTDTIWRTNDGGVTWTVTTVPNLTLMSGAYVDDITFENGGVIGFAAVRGNGIARSLGATGVLQTTDSGKTWAFNSGTGSLPDSAAGIYYNNNTNLLFVSGLDTGLVVSNNGGASFTYVIRDSDYIQSDSNFYTGYAFIDDVKGAVATQYSLSGGGIYHHWLLTFDGGQTWTKSKYMYTESWQPMGITTTSTYFTTTDNYQTGTTPDAIERSDNDGESFSPVLLSTMDTFTQAMAGDACAMFASSTNLGMFVSINDGKSWQPMVGAPNPSFDTRFWVSPTTIWSFQDTTLFSAPRPTTTDIHVWPDTIDFTTAGCYAVDTTIHVFGCNCSNNLILRKDSIVRLDTNSMDASDTFGPAMISPPNQALCPSGVDSVDVSYRPTTPDPDSANIFLLFSDNGAATQVPIFVKGGGVTSMLGQIPPPGPGKDLVRFSEPACVQFDTFVTVFNTGCSNIQIFSITVTGDAESACAIDVESPALPFNLDEGPGAVFQLPIHFNGGLQPNIFCVTVTVYGKSGTFPNQVLDSAQFQVCGQITTNLKPAVVGFNDTFASCCKVPVDTLIYFENTTCDTITLQNEPVVNGIGGPAINIVPVAPSSNCFIFDSASTDKPLFTRNFPLQVPPNTIKSFRILLPVPCEATKCRAVVWFNGVVGSNTEGCAATAPLDSVMLPIGLDILADAPEAASASTTSLKFGTVSCCDTETKTVILTSVCIPLHYEGISQFTDGGGHFKILYQPAIDTVFTPGTEFYNHTKDSIVVQLIPPPCDSSSLYPWSATGGFRVNWAEYPNPTAPQIISLSASASSSVAVSQSSYNLNYDTLDFCSQMCDSATITNISCPPGTPEIIGSNPSPTVSNPAFTLVSPVKGESLPTGGSIPLVVCLNPESSGQTGPLTAQVVFEVTDLSGHNPVYDTTNIVAYVNPPVPGYTVTPLASDSVCDSATLTEQFTVTNNGECYTYVITNGSASGPGVQVMPQGSSYPLRIGPGSTGTFSVTFNPGGNPAPLTGTITLTDSGGNNITEAYSIPVKVCSVPGKFTLTSVPANDTITTPNCQQGTFTFTAGAGGGSGMVTSVTVTPSGGRFSVTGADSGPMPFNGTVTFDPNQAGVNTATVTLNYTINGGAASSVTIPLAALVTGTQHTARVGIISETDVPVEPNDSMLKDFEVILRDTVANSLGMMQLHLLIGFDGNLLWQGNNPAINFIFPDGAWSLGTEYQDNMGMHITLDYKPGIDPKNWTGGNDTIVKVQLYAAVSDSNCSVAYADSTHFNDSAYEACTLKALSITDDSNTVSFCIDTTACARGILEQALPQNLQPYSGVAIIPNPAHKDGVGALLNFSTNIDGVVNADVLDILGNTVLNLSNTALAKGDHSLPIPTENLSEGDYFVRVQMRGYTVIRKFVLQKE